MTRSFHTSFSPTPFEEWRRSVESGGRSLDTLSSRTADDIDVHPLYPPHGPRDGVLGPHAFTRERATWTARPRYRSPAVADVLRRLDADAQRGATAFWIVAGDGNGPGVHLDSDATIQALVSGIDWSTHDVLFAAGSRTPDVVRAVRAAVAEPGMLRGCLGLDPLSAQPDVATWCTDHAPRMRSHLVSTRADHDAGATPVQEIALVLATGVHALRALTATGLSVDDAANQLMFQISMGSDLFVDMAKLRAARTLWGVTVAASGGDDDARAMCLHATTSSRTRTRRAPYVNVVRGTVEAAAAIFGGADSITVLPFDDALGDSDPLAERLAWNTHVILGEESYLSSVIDPGAGSGYVESLTNELASRAWSAFQEIESAGGIASVRESGTWDENIRHACERTARDIARRRPRIVGVSDFVQLDEPVLERRPVEPVASLRRLAEPFESLRDAVDRLPDRPSVFLASLGPPAEHKPRTRFAAQFVAVAGITSIEYEGSDDPAAVANAFAPSGCRVAILCATDERRADDERTLVTALTSAGAERVYVAGRPLPTEGAENVIHVYEGCDVLDTLTNLVRFLGGRP